MTDAPQPIPQPAPKVDDDWCQILREFANTSGWGELVEVGFKEFLEGVPPNEKRLIQNFAEFEGKGAYFNKEIRKTPIEKHCPVNACNGIRFFDCKVISGYFKEDSAYTNFVLRYVCRNCHETTYLISIRTIAAHDSPHGICEKYGEIPKYGLPDPTRLTKIIRENVDCDLLEKGFACESDAKGIGAFAYYRRLVDSVKNQLIEEIANAVERIDPKHEMLTHLSEAKKETRFSEAIQKIKDTLPKELYIDGHNPLTALYSALSGGIHEESDAECLALAADVRTILTELFEKTAFILENKKTVSEALKRLIVVLRLKLTQVLHLILTRPGEPKYGS